MAGIGLGTGDYFIVAGNVVYNTSSKSIYAESGIGVYEPVKIPGFSSDLPWDNQTYHIQVLQNVVHDNSEGPSIPASKHSDGNGIIMDDFGLAQWIGGPGPYPYKSLVLGNVSYNNGGRGIQVGPTSGNVDVYNNTSYNNNLDTIWPETVEARRSFGVTIPMLSIMFSMPFLRIRGQLLTTTPGFALLEYRQLYD